MDQLFKPEFWTQLGIPPTVAAMIVIGLIALGIGWSLRGLKEDGQIKALKEQKRLAEDRLAQVRDQNAGESKTITGIQARLTDLEKRVTEHAPAHVLRPIFEQLVSDTGSLASSTATITKIVSTDIYAQTPLALREGQKGITSPSE